jgi:phage shock protein E
MNKSMYAWSFAAIVAITLVLFSLSDATNTESVSMSATPFTAVSNVASVEAETFASLLTEDTPILIDVRTPQEFAAGHLDGAINIDFYDPNFRSEIAKLDPKKQYAIYCRTGNRTGQTLTMMKTLGFTNVTDLKGGIVAWEQNGFSVCTADKC